MRYQRRVTMLAATVAGASLVLAGCGSSGSAGEASADSEQSINVWGWSGAPGADVMANVVKAFEAANPKIKVTYNEIANTDYANKATLGLSSKQPIDVIGVFPNEWAKDNEGYLLPVDKWPGVDGLMGKFQDQAVTQVKRLFSDGVVRAAPLDSNGSAVGYYNMDLLKKAGLSKPPTTWAEMKQLSDGLAKNAPGVIPALIPSDHWFQDDFVQTLIGQYDPGFWNNVVYNSGPWDTPAVRDALTLYQGLFADGTLDKATLDVQYADAKSLFGTGKAAIIFSGTWDSGLLLESYRKANNIAASEVGAMAVPAVDPNNRGARAFLDTTYGIPTASQHQAAAAKFIEFMTAGDGVDVWARSLVGVPVLKGWTLPTDALTTDTAREGYAALQALIADPHSDRYVMSNLEGQQGSYDLQVASGDLSPAQAAQQGQADVDSGKYN